MHYNSVNKSKITQQQRNAPTFSSMKYKKDSLVCAYK